VRGNPVNIVDSSGEFPEYCRTLGTAIAYEDCVLKYYNLRPAETPLTGKDVKEGLCGFYGPVHYRAQGYLEGVGGFFVTHRRGREIVYDFATWERNSFDYIGGSHFDEPSPERVLSEGSLGGMNDSFVGIGAAQYAGLVQGLRTDSELNTQYGGHFYYGAPGLSGEYIIGPSWGFILAYSPDDPEVWSVAWYSGFSASLDPIPVGDIDVADVYYRPVNKQSENYINENTGEVDIEKLTAHIGSGDSVPFYLGVPHIRVFTRVMAMNKARTWLRVYEEIHENNKF
jgi:hypothetical protein